MTAKKKNGPGGKSKAKGKANGDAELQEVALDDVGVPGIDEPMIEEAAFEPEAPKPESVSREHLKSVIESLVFVSDRPVTAKDLARVVRSKKDDVLPLLEEIREEYKGRGVELFEVNGGYQFRTSAANAPFVRDYVEQRPVRLTRAQLETLAIVAYRQPVTRPEIDDIRGVDSGSALKVLLERGILKILGKKEEAGRPIIYGTTPAFLEFFGMNTLTDLPTLKEFTDLSDESRELFERRAAEGLGDLKQAGVDAAAEGAGAAAVAASWDEDQTEITRPAEMEEAAAGDEAQEATDSESDAEASPTEDDDDFDDDTDDDDSDDDSDDEDDDDDDDADESDDEDDEDDGDDDE